MKKSFFYFFTISFLLGKTLVYAQQNEVTVNPITGSANVNIPLCTIKSGSLSTSMNLLYGDNGIKVKDVEGNGGIGWRVTGGGQISRELRGLPDDIQKDEAGNNRLGWIYNTNGTKINNLAIANTGTPNCANEATDITSLNNNFSDLSDTEPDMFYINAPGLSCAFIFDNNHNIKTIPYRDVKISTTTDPGTGAILTFSVINDQGIKYTFSNPAGAYKQTTNTIGSGSTLQTVNENNIAYLRNQYQQYKFGVSYFSAWYLSSVNDNDGNALTFSYNNGLQQANETPVEFYIGSTTKTTQYWNIDIDNPKILANITGNLGSIDIDYAYNYRTAVPMISRIRSNQVSYYLNYSAVVSSSGKYARYFLRDVTTDQCNTSFKYHFTYYSETLSNNQYSTALSDSVSKSIDYWGYENGYSNTDLSPAVNINTSAPSYQRYQIVTDNASRPAYAYTITGADRRASPTAVMAGALSQITYFNNGSTTLTYESNSYYDPTGNITVLGGGIRVKQVSTYNGISTTNNIVRNYSYVNPATGLTSGKPVSLPVYAFTRPYTGSGATDVLWTASTVRSELDLSNDDHSIYYSHVSLTQTGAGKTVYEYYLPATNYDLSATPACNNCSTADWAPNLVNVARPGCAASGFVGNDISTYPFAPTTNYDFERGLIKKISNYNDAGSEVSESNYAYQRTGTPEITTALKFDDNSTVKAYLKYKTYTSAGELNQQVSNKVFDLNSTTLSQQNSTNYFYGSIFHKLPTQIQTTKSDGTVVNNYVKYSKDYTTAANMTDPSANALYNLQLQNVNLPVENYTQVIKEGLTKTTLAQLIKFGSFTFNTVTRYLPTQRLQFYDQNGVTAFTPSTISGGVFVFDANKYIVTENDLVYDQFGVLQTRDDNRKHVQTVLSDLTTHLPLAVASNASVKEIGYYSYSYSTDNAQFATTASLLPSGGRTVAPSSSLSFGPGVIFTKTITKNVNIKSYNFSIWINSGFTGNINLTLTGSDNVPHVYPVSFTNTGGWKYYEIKVPVAGLSNIFTAAFQNASANTVSIDDVLFYPESAEVVSYKYTNPYNQTLAKIAETNTNGVSTYFVPDNLGRVTLTYDQDKQIMARKSYNYADNLPSFTEPAFSDDGRGQAIVGKDVHFNTATNYNPCQFIGLTYTWNFGDGSAPIVATSNTGQTHQYTSAGTYTVTETVTAPGYGTKSKSYTIEVIPVPLVIPVFYVNNCAAGSMSKVTFSQGGVVKYTFTEADLLPANPKIPEGSYNVQVKGTGTIGSVTIQGGGANYCLDQPLPTGNYVAVSVNLVSGSSLSISLKDFACN